MDICNYKEKSPQIEVWGLFVVLGTGLLLTAQVDWIGRETNLTCQFTHGEHD